MILTEEEAKEKACCANAARIFEDNSRIARGVCLGSACMAWRWYVPPHHVSARWDEPEEVTKARIKNRRAKRGYCGLAEKPE